MIENVENMLRKIPQHLNYQARITVAQAAIED